MAKKSPNRVPNRIKKTITLTVDIPTYRKLMRICAHEKVQEKHILAFFVDGYRFNDGMEIWGKL